MSDPSPLLLEILADRYRVERQIGQRGMATVYLAEDLKLERQVARVDVFPTAGGTGEPWSRSFAEQGAVAWMSDGSLAFSIWSGTDAVAIRQVSGPGRERTIGSVGHVANRLSLSRDLKRAAVQWRDNRADAWMYRVVRP